MKALIPIAGLGTRLLPFSKVIPKAMLPAHNKPCVQWIVEELVKAGIEEIIFIYSKGQEMVKEYFTEETWYDQELKKRGKQKEAKMLEKVRKMAKFHFVEQKEQLGDGHAILQAKDHIQDEPVIIIFGDCLYQGEEVIKKFIQNYQNHQKSIIAIQEIDPHQTDQYGIVSLKETIDSRLSTLDHLIEKPHPSESPSNLAIIGRYLLSPSIWKHLEKEHSDSGEIRLIDALQSLQKEEELLGLELKGTWLDTGTLEGLQTATEHFKQQSS